MKKTEATRYGFKIFNGRVKVYVNDYVMFTFNQIDFKGYYAYKDDTLLYGLDIYLMNEKGGATTIQHSTLSAPDAYAAHRFDKTLRSINTITYHNKYGMISRNIIPVESL